MLCPTPGSAQSLHRTLFFIRASAAEFELVSYQTAVLRIRQAWQLACSIWFYFTGSMWTAAWKVVSLLKCLCLCFESQVAVCGVLNSCT